MSNSKSSVYRVLRPKIVSGLPAKVTCFALNYATHKLMVCNKQDLYLYDLESQSVIDYLGYARKFEKIYDSEVQIRSIDALILSGLWVALVNKKSLLFFNDKLEFSRIYSAEANPAISLQVMQRTNDIVTLRADRKMIKLWRFEYQENIEKPEEKDNSDINNSQQSSDKNGLKNIKADINMEKHKSLMDKGQSFEVTLYTRKSLTFPANRLVMNIAFSEELNLTVITMDNMEIFFYHTVSCELMQIISFSSSISNDVDMFNIPTISIEQELLYYCDDKKMVIFDLLLNQEVTSYQHNFSFQVLSIHAERSNPNGGVYLATDDDKIHCYSHSARRILWTEEGKESKSISFGEDSPKKSDLSPSDKNKWFSRLGTFSELGKKEFNFKDKFSRMHFHFMTDTNSSGLTTFFTLAFGYFKVFDLMSPGKICFQAPYTIQSVIGVTAPEPEPSSTVDIGVDRKDYKIQAKLTYENHKVTHHDMKNFSSISKSSLDIIQAWKTAAYDSNPNNAGYENLETLEVLSVFQIPEDKIYVVVTPDHLHVVSLYYKRRMMHKSMYNDITACAAICISSDNDHRDTFYITVGTSKGVIVILECDFVFKQFSILKNIIRHDQVLALRYIPEVSCLLSVGTEGNIFLYDVKERDKEPNLLFNVEQSHKLIWNQVSSLIFLNDSKIVAGLGNGAVQVVRYNWKENLKVHSELLEYHEAPVKHLAAINHQTDHTVELICCCEEGIITYWQVGKGKPVKIFRLADPINSLIITKNPINEKTEMFVGLKNIILKLDYSFGGKILRPEPNSRQLWSEAVTNRMKHFTKIIRESKTMVTKLGSCLDRLKALKQTENDLSDGPFLVKYLFDLGDGSGIKSLENDFSRYVSSKKTMQNTDHIWILDSILTEFFRKKLADEPIYGRPEVKGEKRVEGGSILNTLSRTLKKYPIIKSIILDKFKESELYELHKNIVLLLNHVYRGEDNLEDQYEFLKTKYNIKRDDLDEGHFVRAKKLYYLKKPVSHAGKSMASVIPTPPVQQVSSKHIKPNSKPVNLPSITPESPQKNSHLFKSFYSPPASPKLKALNPVLSYKQYSKQIEKEISGSNKTQQEFVKSVVQKNEMVKFVVPQKYYQPYLAKKSKGYKSSLNSSLVPSTSVSGIMSPNAPSANTTFDGLAIGQAEHTLAAPTFTNSRSDFYKTMFITEPRQRKEPQRINTTAYVNFPKREPKDFVVNHSKGFTLPENTDFYKHVLRHIIKHQCLFSRTRRQNEGESSQSPVKRREKEEEDIEYIPITIKQFILETNKEQMALLTHIPKLYELKTGTPLFNESKDDYDVLDIEEKLEKENWFLENVLSNINDNGIEAVKTEDMTKFKKIVKRRMKIFTKLETFIEESGVLSKESNHPEDVPMKEEIKETISRIQEIRINLGIEDIPQKALYSSAIPEEEAGEKDEQFPEEGGQHSRTASAVSMKGSVPFSGDNVAKRLTIPRGSVMGRESSGSQGEGSYTSRILKTILESVDTFKGSPKHGLTLSPLKEDQSYISRISRESSQPRESFVPVPRKGSMPRKSSIGEEPGKPTPGTSYPSTAVSSPKFFSLIKDIPYGNIGNLGKYTIHPSVTLKISESSPKAQFGQSKTFNVNGTIEGMSDASQAIVQELAQQPQQGGTFKKVKKTKRNPNVNTSSGTLVTTTPFVHRKAVFNIPPITEKPMEQVLQLSKESSEQLLPHESEVTGSFSPTHSPTHGSSTQKLKRLGTALLDVFAKGTDIGMLLKGKKNFSRAQTMIIKDGLGSIKIDKRKLKRSATVAEDSPERPMSAPGCSIVFQSHPGDTTSFKKESDTDVRSIRFRSRNFDRITTQFNPQLQDPRLKKLLAVERKNSMPEKRDMSKVRESMTIDVDEWKEEYQRRKSTVPATPSPSNARKLHIPNGNKPGLEGDATGWSKSTQRDDSHRMNPRKSIKIPVDHIIDDDHQPQTRKSSMNTTKNKKTPFSKQEDHIQMRIEAEGVRRQSINSPTHSTSDDNSSRRQRALSKGKTDGNLLKRDKPQIKVSTFAAKETKPKRKNSLEEDKTEESEEEESSVESPTNEMSSVMLTTKSDIKEENSPLLEKKSTGGATLKLKKVTKGGTKKVAKQTNNTSPKSPDVAVKAKQQASEHPEAAGTGAAHDILTKIEELPEETASARLRKQEEDDDDDDGILDDPLALFNQVMNDGDVDEQTKLDLFLYGNRKQALKDYIQQIEANLEMNILSQKDCHEQLANFFDINLGNLSLHKNLAFSNPLLVPYTDASWEEKNPHRFGGRATGDLGKMLYGDNTSENLRRKAFLRQKEYINHLRLLETKAVSDVGQTNVCEANLKPGAIILSEQIIDTLLFQGSNLLNAVNPDANKKEELDMETITLSQKLKRLREILKKLKVENPPAFVALVTTFKKAKERYDEAMQESQARQIEILRD